MRRGRLLRGTVGDWYQDRAQQLGAALPFYTLFGLAPGLVILIPLTGVFLGPQAAQGHIVEQIESLIGRPGGGGVRGHHRERPRGGAGVTVIAVITLVFGLWWVFGERQDALNTKGFLSQRGVRYVERDVTVDVAALDELSALGVMTTPVTTINGEVVIGFDQKRLDALLGR